MQNVVKVYPLINEENPLNDREKFLYDSFSSQYYEIMHELKWIGRGSGKDIAVYKDSALAIIDKVEKEAPRLVLYVYGVEILKLKILFGVEPEPEITPQKEHLTYLIESLSNDVFDVNGYLNPKMRLGGEPDLLEWGPKLEFLFAGLDLIKDERGLYLQPLTFDERFERCVAELQYTAEDIYNNRERLIADRQKRIDEVTAKTRAMVEELI